MALLAAFLLSSWVSAPKAWVLAFERDDDIWISRADGTYARREIKNGRQPRWSPDGRQIAFTRGEDVFVFDARSHRARKAFDHNDQTGPVENVSDLGEPTVAWDSKRPILWVGFENSNHFRTLDSNSFEYADFFVSNADEGMKTNSASWNRTGTLMAYVREGDIWILEPRESAEDTRTSRVAAVATYDLVHSSSLSTEYWASDLTWSPSGRRIYFDLLGSHGSSKMGYVKLLPTKREGSFGYRFSVGWLSRDADYRPTVCPDGKTLSFVHRWWQPQPHQDLYVSDLEGHHRRKLLGDVTNYDWRP